MIPALVFLLGIPLLMLLYVVVTYNTLVALKNHIREAWSDIETELKRRYELIPNLVETVKGYAKHERELLERVVELRNQCAQNHGSVAEQAETEKQLVSQLQRLLVLVEQYPELKADQHFLELQKELVNTENRIQAARRFFNGNVRDYRNKCEQFPSGVVARLFGFRPESYFEVERAVRDVPQVGMG